VRLLGTRLYVGFDAHSVVVATLSRGPSRSRVETFGRRPLASGALVPSPSGHNVVRRDDVSGVLAELLAELAPGRGRGTLVLPDGIARLVVARPPAGSEIQDYLRFRLASSLPWPISEAIVNLLPVGGGDVVGAAVRRATITEYEQLAVSLGLTVEHVHLAPLLALQGLLKRRGRTGVHAILGDAALCLVVMHDGRLATLRNRRRDISDGEGTRLLNEAARAAREAVNGVDPSRLTLEGSGAGRLRDELGLATAVPDNAVSPREWPEAEEVAWLGGALG
jgi:hypothetical protein